MRYFLIAITFCAFIAAAQAQEFRELRSDKRLNWEKPDWLVGKWNDTKRDNEYKKIRAEIERIPVHDRSVKEKDIDALIAGAKERFDRSQNWANLYRLTYAVGRFHESAHQLTTQVRNILMSHTSPDSREFARAVFCLMVFSDDFREARPLMSRMKPICSNDPLLQEALIVCFGSTYTDMTTNEEWRYEIAWDLYRKHPASRYFYAYYVIRAISFRSLKKATTAATQQGIREIDDIVAQGSLDAKGIDFAHSVQKQMQRISDITQKRKGGG